MPRLLRRLLDLPYELEKPSVLQFLSLDDERDGAGGGGDDGEVVGGLVERYDDAGSGEGVEYDVDADEPAALLL